MPGRGPRDQLRRLVDRMPNLPDAACKARPELPWTDDGYGPGVRAAIGVCSGCLEVAACRAYAMAHPEVVGVWGGLTADDRTDLRFYHRGGTP